MSKPMVKRPSVCFIYNIHFRNLGERARSLRCKRSELDGWLRFGQTALHFRRSSKWWSRRLWCDRIDWCQGNDRGSCTCDETVFSYTWGLLRSTILRLLQVSWFRKEVDARQFQKEISSFRCREQEERKMPRTRRTEDPDSKEKKTVELRPMS